ncbi:hypothetical protein MW887_011562 [Aspergillus wentii]|nr:hypothetical protein MW887_011562 [Aspergillus wentii]
MIQRRLQSLGNVPDNEDEPDRSFRATGLQSSSSCISSAMMYFPPRNIAEFLTDTFLEFAQTNYYYFDETTFRQKLEYYYTNKQPLTIHDAGWVCTLLMTLAVGTQFAYMQTKPAHGTPVSENIPDDHVGLELYRFSCRLIPDLITIASVETVQAFLLLGIYTLPIDTSGLAYTYYGLAIKMAVQNGMHRRFYRRNADITTVELRNRLWWSAYSLECRISILHGRPVSVSSAETDADMPVDIPSITSSRVSNLPNFTAVIFLTSRLSEACNTIKSLRRCPRNHQSGYLDKLTTIRSRLRAWWSSLPSRTHCRDLNPDGPLFRCNVHLELNYTTATIYMGRPFIFSHQSGEESPSSTRSDPMTDLRVDSLNAAIRAIELCQLLQNSGGLARVSYTEFNACRAALLALIAHGLNEATDAISTSLTQGMSLIRQMCVGLESARSEVAVIEALERARQRLNSRSQTENTVTEASGYDQFRQWARLWQSEPVTSTPDLELQTDTTVPSFDGFFSSFPNELNAFAAIPGSEENLSLGSNWMDELQIPDDPLNLDSAM